MTSTPSSVRTAWKWLADFHTAQAPPLRQFYPDLTVWQAVDKLALEIWGCTWMDEHDRRVWQSLAGDAFRDWDGERRRRYMAKQHTGWMIDDAVRYLRGQPPL